MDVVIVGGGVIGMLTARELHDAGAKVTLIERNGLGQESSWAGGGILSPLNPWQVPEAITALCFWSQAHYRELAEQLQAASGIDPEWQQSGLVFRGLEGDELTTWATHHGVDALRVGASVLSALEPRLNVHAGESGVLLPKVAQIRNPRLVAALSKDIARRGIPVQIGHPVESLDIQEGRVRSVATATGRFEGDRYVIAAGAWSGRLAKTAEARVDVQPVRGQMLVFAAQPGLLSHIVLDAGRYLIPRRDGRILAGSTVEYAGFDKLTTQESGTVLAEFAYRQLPALQDFPIERHWAGLRPGSPQGVPYIGPHPSLNNLYFNCGHFRNGLVMGPASARLLADLMLDRRPIVTPDPYAISD